MYILNRHFNNRAISQVIAALLLIAIAVAAAILVYVFSIGLLGSLQGGGGQQTKQQLIAEAYNWLTLDDSHPALTVRNVGTANMVVADVFVNGLTTSFTIDPGGTGCDSPTGTVPVQTSCLLTVTGDPTVTNGVAYTIKVVTADGAVFSYSAIAGQAS
jgi:flagellin-like protein